MAAAYTLALVGTVVLRSMMCSNDRIAGHGMELGG